jgi:hypothetical protein
MLSRGKIL